MFIATCSTKYEYASGATGQLEHVAAFGYNYNKNNILSMCAYVCWRGKNFYECLKVLQFMQQSVSVFGAQTYKYMHMYIHVYIYIVACTCFVPQGFALSLALFHKVDIDAFNAAANGVIICFSSHRATDILV